MPKVTVGHLVHHSFRSARVRLTRNVPHPLYLLPVAGVRRVRDPAVGSVEAR